MGKGAPLRWLENRRLGKYLHGCGLEIGALWRRFPVPRRARVWYVDRFTPTELTALHKNTHEHIVAPDLVAEAAQLPLAPASVDFIIASHVLEHMPFPLAALRAWHDVLEPGGALVLRTPDKRYTFDARRPRTPLAHLVAEYEHPERFDAGVHYAEWAEHVVGYQPGTPEFEGFVQTATETRHDIHFHVWTDDDVRELLEFTRRAWGLAWTPRVFWRAHFYRKESVALLLRDA